MRGEDVHLLPALWDKFVLQEAIGMLRKQVTMMLVILGLVLSPFSSFNGAHAFAETGQDPFAELWDRIDGYPSMQPLTYALYNYFAQQDVSSAKHVYHSQEWLDLLGLLEFQFFHDGNPLLFTSYLTPEELAAYGAEYGFIPLKEDELASIREGRRDLGAEYDFVPIAKDALVFMNNINNPITDLCQDQIQGIYVGNITNWSQVGGSDAQIKAFQHGYLSVAQVIFENTLMRDFQPIDKITKYIEFGIDDPGEVIEGYDNGLYSVGYTRYFCAKDNYLSGKARILSVDGVMPTPQSISSGEYPLSTLCYAVLPKGDSRNPLAEELVAWLLTSEGQRVIQSAGYAPLNESDCTDDVYTSPPFPQSSTQMSKGSGGIPDRNAELPVYSSGFIYADGKEMVTLKGETKADYQRWYDEGGKLSVVLPWNSELENEINTWCEQTRDHFFHLFPDVENVADAIQEHVYVYGNLVSFYFQAGDGANTIIETAVFDLKEGKRLALSDLFLDGYNYIDYINSQLMIASLGEQTGWPGQFRGEEDYLRRPFSGLPADYPYFIVDNGMLHIAMQGDNPFYQVSEKLWSTLLLESIPLMQDISSWGGSKIDNENVT